MGTACVWASGWRGHAWGIEGSRAVETCGAEGHVGMGVRMNTGQRHGDAYRAVVTEGQTGGTETLLGHPGCAQNHGDTGTQQGTWHRATRGVGAQQGGTQPLSHGVTPHRAPGPRLMGTPHTARTRPLFELFFLSLLPLSPPLPTAVPLPPTSPTPSFPFCPSHWDPVCPLIPALPPMPCCPSVPSAPGCSVPDCMSICPSTAVPSHVLT